MLKYTKHNTKVERQVKDKQYAKSYYEKHKEHLQAVNCANYAKKKGTPVKTKAYKKHLKKIKCESKN